MKSRKSVTLAALMSLAPAAAMAAVGDVPSGEYELEDTHGYITFSYSHLGFSRPVVEFTEFDVALDLNQDDVSASTLRVDIEPTSISSNVEKFDDHLKSDDFFHVEQHEDISFVATSIEQTSDSTYAVTGDLTIKGITKPVTLEATINKAANHPMRGTPTIGVSATGTLMRSDWDLGKYAPNVGDEVTLNIQTELALASDD